MQRIWRTSLIASAITLAMMVLGLGVALADKPTDSTTPMGTGEIYYRMAENRYSLHDTRLESCYLCHAGTPAGAITGMNSYGNAIIAQLTAMGKTLSWGNGVVDVKDQKPIDDALIAIESADSDTDTVKNGLELWSLSNPGDANDKFLEEPAPTAFAVGPHGGYGATPDQCATCHRTHTAKAAKLLLQNQQALCYTCHGNGGAATNVRDGVGRDGISGLGLKGGGFEKAKMQTAVNTTVTDGPVDSSHTVSGIAGIMWGSGAITTTVFAGKAGVTLECGNCHDPHLPSWTTGEGQPVYLQYRMLKGSPRESGAVGESGQAKGFFLSIPDTITGTIAPITSAQFRDVNKYAQTYQDDFRPDTSYQPNDRIGEFCALCHTRYMAASIILDTADSHGSTVGATDSTDPIFAYRHATKEASCNDCHISPPLGMQPPADSTHKNAWSRPRCLDCHVGHGTVAVMTGDAKTAAWPGGVAPGGSNQPAEGNNRSSLRRLNNYGVCTSCHEK